MAARKINLKNISEEANNICQIKFYKIKFLYSKTNSSAILDNKTQMVLEHFLPIILLQIFHFYDIKNANLELEKGIKDILNHIYDERMKSFTEELGDTSRKYLQPTKKILNKLWVVKKKHTKELFEKLDFITFDDKSNDASHLKAFNNEHSSTRKNNFILKIDSTGPESTPIRFGVYVDKNNVELLDLVTK